MTAAGPNLHARGTGETVAGMHPFRRPIAIPRADLAALLDTCDPARSPAASRVYELLLDIENASADIAIVIAGDPPSEAAQ